jgi:GTP-binding protein Era
MPEFRSGMVAVVGRPNVGKSTLINALIGQKIAAVSPRPQTTRRRQLGIVTRTDAQLVFVDTPGMHMPRHRLGQFLVQEAHEALRGIDIAAFMIDISILPDADDERIASTLAAASDRALLVLLANKIDRVPPEDRTDRLQHYRELLHVPFEEASISATRGDGLADLVDLLIRLCPVRPAEFSEDQVTDLYERDIAADLIREAALLNLRDEVPHSIAIRIDEFQERPNGSAFIAATLLVERDSQKGIVIGEGGRMLKQIGTNARREIESMGGRKVFLELHVKVEKGWRNSRSALERLGYKLNSESPQ